MCECRKNQVLSISEEEAQELKLFDGGHEIRFGEIEIHFADLRYKDDGDISEYVRTTYYPTVMYHFEECMGKHMFSTNYIDCDTKALRIICTKDNTYLVFKVIE